MMPQSPLPKWPSDQARIRNNRRLVAERTGWPEGALPACAELEQRHPGWHVWWMPENVWPGWERPAGFSAANDTVIQHEVKAFRTDLKDLEAVMAEGVPSHEYGTPDHLSWCAWCLAHPGPRPVKL